MQAVSKEGPIAQITANIFMGQQLLWFHKGLFHRKKIGAVLDITVENHEPYFISMNKSIHYQRIPVLDKTSPSLEQLERGVVWGLHQLNQGKNLYVHCGAGHERSAMFVAAILLRSKICASIEESLNVIKTFRPKAGLVYNQYVVLKQWLNL